MRDCCDCKFYTLGLTGFERCNRSSIDLQHTTVSPLCSNERKFEDKWEKRKQSTRICLENIKSNKNSLKQG
ncbi:MAG TPA: hypothetical protein QF753_00840 [Victivallales bacterium]|nr:hypothetical protein [Victivallales bacterium]